jgi:DNA-binding XRE family transcriptional regulator
MKTKFNRVKDAIDQRGAKQNWLAEQVGITNNAMSAICSNKSQPRLETLFKIAEVLKVDVCELLDKNEGGEIPK